MARKNKTPAGSPRSLDLFCGIGGLTLGLECAGFASIGGVDWWRDAAATFEHNQSHLRCMVSDLRVTGMEEIEAFFGIRRDDVDLLAGGPPCQGFSTVGKRDGKDPRNRLWGHFLELVRGIRPPYLLIENVEGLVVMNRGAVRDQILGGFATLGYHMRWRLLRSADYGVPQLRKRVIFLGWLDGLAEPSFPDRSHEEPVTVAEAIFDLPPLEAGQKAESYAAPPATEYQRSRRMGCHVLHNHEAANHSRELVEILRHIPDGGNRKAIPPDLQPQSGFHNSYSRLASDKPAVAITSNMRKPSSARATHPIQHRGLTVREGLRLQTFDDDFVELGSRTSQYLQVGNCVPPLLAEAVGRGIARAYHANSRKALAKARTRKVAAIPARDPESAQLLLKLHASLR